jgi:hypothetical protein
MNYLQREHREDLILGYTTIEPRVLYISGRGLLYKKKFCYQRVGRWKNIFKEK